VIFSLLIIAAGSYGVASPASLVALARFFATGPLVWVASALRLAFGVALWLAASSSWTPTAFHVLGAVSLLSGIALPVLGSQRLAAFVQWWTEQPAWFVRLGCGLALALGVFTLGSALPGLR